MKKPIQKLIAIWIVALLCITSVMPVSAADDRDMEITAEIPNVMDGETDLPAEDDDTQSEETGDMETDGQPDAETPEDKPDGELDLDVQDDMEPAAMSLSVEWPLATGTHDKYMSGLEDGRFWPEKYMTRAQFAQVIYNLLRNKPSDTKNVFLDVNINSSGQWYAAAVNALGNAGIMTGTDGRFNPGSYITRAQAVTAFARFFDAVSGSVNFPDVSAGHWAYDDLVTAYQLGWIEGDDNGRIRPNGYLKRSELTKMANKVLGRTDSADYAKDRDDSEMYFPDVPKTYWGFLDIIEAAKPGVKAPEPTPEDTYYKITAVNGLNIRSGPGTTYSTLIALPFGTVVKAVDVTTSAPWYKVTYGSTTGYAHSDYLALTNDGEQPGAGDGVISATTASLPQYKTLYLTASVNGSSSGLTWQSDNTDVAMIVSTKVTDGGKSFVYGKAQGTANIIVRNAAGQEVARCKVTVGSPEALRFITSEPNTPSKGQAFDLIAVTDSSKAAVKFVITGPENATYETTTYTDERQKSSVNANLPENVARNFTRSVTLGTAGSYTVRAYSKTASGDWSTSYKEKKLLVVSTQSDTEVSAEKRATSSKMIDIIAQFEGRRNDVYLDTLANNIPTVGCGYVVYKNGTFYNNLTTTEMDAMLGETINSDGYETAVENFRSKNGMKMSQAQFDALVSFAYNLGGGIISSEYGTFKVMLNATAKTSGSGKISASSAALYAEASSSGNKITDLKNDASVTVSEIKRVDGKVDSLWYKVTSGNYSGWVRGGNVKMNDAGTVDLAYIDEQSFGSNLLLWHNAGGVAVPGLVTRRLAEAKIFCYAGYDEAYHSSRTYTTNVGFDIPSAFVYTETDGVGRWTTP